VTKWEERKRRSWRGAVKPSLTFPPRGTAIDCRPIGIAAIPIAEWFMACFPFPWHVNFNYEFVATTAVWPRNIDWCVSLCLLYYLPVWITAEERLFLMAVVLDSRGMWSCSPGCFMYWRKAMNIWGNWSKCFLGFSKSRNCRHIPLKLLGILPKYRKISKSWGLRVLYVLVLLINWRPEFWVGETFISVFGSCK
jgi:hypothetical protein